MPRGPAFQIAALALLALALVACSGGKKAGSDGPTGASMPDARPFDTPAPGTPLPIRQVTGLFAEPKDTKVTKATLGIKPASTLQPSDRKSVVVYDTQTGKQTDFGPGTITAPVFNKGRLLYTADKQAWLVDLTTMDKKSLGGADLAYFVDETHVLLIAFQQRNILLNLATGERALANSLSDTVVGEQESLGLGGPLRRHLISGGAILNYAVDVEKLYALKCRLTPTPESDLCGLRFKEEYSVEDGKGNVVFQFRALQASPAGPNEIVVATSPLCDDGNGKQIWCEEELTKLDAASGGKPGNFQYAKGTTNIFLVDLASGKAKFIATAAYDPRTQLRPYNWPLSADANYVVWTEDYCGQTKGKTRVYDRKSGQIKELDQTLWVRMDGGLIGAGEFGARAMIDPASLQYKTVLPDNLPDVTWSDDYRYAAVGQASPHGGLCGG